MAHTGTKGEKVPETNEVNNDVDKEKMAGSKIKLSFSVSTLAELSLFLN